MNLVKMKSEKKKKKEMECTLTHTTEATFKKKLSSDFPLYYRKSGQNEECQNKWNIMKKLSKVGKARGTERKQNEKEIVKSEERRQEIL